MYKKLIYLRMEQKEALDEIQKSIDENGGSVSIMRLMQDSIQIFIQHYSEEAIERYSPFYDKKN